jgi:hypothetical protein
MDWSIGPVDIPRPGPAASRGIIRENGPHRGPGMDHPLDLDVDLAIYQPWTCTWTCRIWLRLYAPIRHRHFRFRHTLWTRGSSNA